MEAVVHHIKSGLQTILFLQTMAEAEDLARKSKASVAVSSRELDQTTLYKREIKNITNQLLGMSHSMQFQSQLLNKTPIH